MMKRILIAIPALVMIAGCMNQDRARDFDEIRAAIEKQSADIAALRTNINELNKSFSLENTELQKDRLVDAALLLVYNGNESTSSQAVQILGYIGGEKAEASLLNILKNGPPNRYSSAFNALSTMQSKKLRDIVMKDLTEGNYQHLNDIVNFIQDRNRNIFTKKDLPLIEKVLSNIEDNDYNNNRYVRNCLIGFICRFDQEKGVKFVCDSLLTASQPYMKRELIYQLASRNNLSPASWGKIINAVGDPQSNSEAYQGILDRMGNSGDWRITDIILSWDEFMTANTNLRNNYIEALGRLRDPKAAEVFLSLCKDDFPRYSHHLNNYPGIKKDGQNYVLADDATIKKLMEQRAKRIEYLNKRDKEDKEPDNNVSLPSPPVSVVVPCN